jgi:hypothetical protein
MSLGSILKKIGSVASTALGILKIAKPILDALRPAVKEIDQAMDKFDELQSMGETEADDFIDRNRGAIVSTKAAFIELQGIGQAGEKACQTLLDAGMDDAVVGEELRVCKDAFVTLHDKIKAAIPNIENASHALDGVK